MSYIACWTCSGTGILNNAGQDICRCPVCKGTCVDIEETKKTTLIAESEKTYKSPLNRPIGTFSGEPGFPIKK
jgi:hypothetical protein